MTGLGDVAEPGIEEILDGIVDPVSGAMRLAGVHRYFDPGPNLPAHERAPHEFLEWLAGWVALTLRADLDELRQRDFIARAVSLYRLRGTKQGLEEFVRIYTRLGVTVDELTTPFQIGVHSTIGVDTSWTAGPHTSFGCSSGCRRRTRPRSPGTARWSSASSTWRSRRTPIMTLDVETPTLQIGVHSTVGIDTLLGPSPH